MKSFHRKDGMSQTFEEIAGRELDALYQGALFLSGGKASSAESLLMDTVTLAFQEHVAGGEVGEVQRWLEGRLVRSFVSHLEAGPTVLPVPAPPRVAVGPTSFEGLGPAELFQAAGALPKWPRAALWLVLLRRWSYADAAAVLEVDASVLEMLLGYRDSLLQAMMSSSRAKRLETGTT